MAIDPITAGLELAKVAVQTIWPDKTEQEKAQLAAAVSLVQGQLAGMLGIGGLRTFEKVKGVA